MRKCALDAQHHGGRRFGELLRLEQAPSAYHLSLTRVETTKHAVPLPESPAGQGPSPQPKLPPNSISPFNPPKQALTILLGMPQQIHHRFSWQDTWMDWFGKVGITGNSAVIFARVTQFLRNTAFLFALLRTGKQFRSSWCSSSGCQGWRKRHRWQLLQGRQTCCSSSQDKLHLLLLVLLYLLESGWWCCCPPLLLLQEKRNGKIACLIIVLSGVAIQQSDDVSVSTEVRLYAAPKCCCCRYQLPGGRYATCKTGEARPQWEFGIFQLIRGHSQQELCLLPCYWTPQWTPKLYHISSSGRAMHSLWKKLFSLVSPTVSVAYCRVRLPFECQCCDRSRSIFSWCSCCSFNFASMQMATSYCCCCSVAFLGLVAYGLYPSKAKVISSASLLELDEEAVVAATCCWSFSVSYMGAIAGEDQGVPEDEIRCRIQGGYLFL